LTPVTRLLEETLKSTGSADPFKNTENSEVLPPLERNTEVLREREETTIKIDPQEEVTGREETKSSSEDTDKPYLDVVSTINSINPFIFLTL
jgi:hypothetical protein